MGRSIKKELIEKSREAMLAAVQIYNSPLIKFKAELFIVTAIISWTYLMHAYYHSRKINYRYSYKKGKRKCYVRTNYGAYKYWDLGHCIEHEASPLDKDTVNNLQFLIKIRNEISHSSPENVDEFIAAKLQACALNYNCVMIDLFGPEMRVDDKLSLAIQFSPITPEQESLLRTDEKRVPSCNIRNFVSEYEANLSTEELNSNKYAYKIVYAPIAANRKKQADKVVHFIKEDEAQNAKAENVLLKYGEKPKFLPKEIVKKMKDEGFEDFTIHQHTQIWQAKDAKNPKYNYGVMVSKQWYWYLNWIDIVRDCLRNKREKLMNLNL